MGTKSEKSAGRVIDRNKALASMDRTKMRATTQADIRRHAAEDGSEPAAPLSEFVKRRPGQRGPGKTPPKVSLTIRVEPDVLQAWRASGDGWQGRARDVLAREAPKVKHPSRG